MAPRLIELKADKLFFPFETDITSNYNMDRLVQETEANVSGLLKNIGELSNLAKSAKDYRDQLGATLEQLSRLRTEKDQLQSIIDFKEKTFIVMRNNSIRLNAELENTKKLLEEAKAAAREPNRSLECAVCIEEKMWRMAYNCGHLTVCPDCDSQINVCPVCRAPITMRLKVILP